MELHGNNHGRLFPFAFGRSCVTRRCLGGPENKKAHSVRVGQKSFDALELDAGLSHPDAAVRKSPCVGIKRERHEKEFSGFGGKGKGRVGDKGGIGGEEKRTARNGCETGG